MQMGVPVVATAVGGIPMVVKPSITGTLIPPGNPMLLAEAILNIKTQYQSALDAAQRAKELVCHEYSSIRMAKDYCELYQSLLSEGQSVQDTDMSVQ